MCALVMSVPSGVEGMISDKSDGDCSWRGGIRNREALLSRVPIPESQVHPLRALDIELPDRFDVVLLGIGNDGHTASLFPDDPALEATAPVARVVRPDHPRLTLTYPVINAARIAAFLVGGAGKREILARVLAGDDTLPSARVKAEETVVLADRAAAPTG